MKIFNDSKLSPLSCPYPKKHSEFHLHALTYMALRNAGYDAHAEHKVFLSPDIVGSSKKPYVRFDIAVFADRKLLALVEVKNSANHWLSETRQSRRYTKFGVPVYLIWDEKHIQPLLTAIYWLFWS